MFRFPEKLEQPEVYRLVEFLSHQIGSDGKRLTKAEVKRLLADRMPRDNATGRPIDEHGYPFDPEQVDRRKKGIPAAFCRSAREYMEERYNVLEMYYVLRHVFMFPIKEHDFLYRAVAERQFGIRGKTLGSIHEMADALHTVHRIFDKKTSDNYYYTYYLVVTMSDKSELNISPMEVKFLDDPLAMPEFTTRTYSGGNVVAEVTGFIMEASSFLYTIGQDFGLSNLRISKLQIIPRIKNDTQSQNRYDLAGLRLGGFSNKQRPNAHRVFAYQISDVQRMSEITDNIKSWGSLRRYESEDSLAQGLSKDFAIVPDTSDSIIKFLTTDGEFSGHLDTPPFGSAL